MAKAPQDASHPGSPEPGGYPLETIDVAAGLIFRQGRLLLARRRPGDHLGGLWEFPGGKREPGETFAECLRRELREELGVEVEVGEVIESVTHDYAARRVRLEFLRCRLLQGEPRALGCQELVWVSAGELRAFEFPAADARLLERLECSPQLWR
jgi:mutator protein MutT